MAKFIIEYEIHVGDHVWFDNNGVRQLATVQDISHIPDIWIEGYDRCELKRWCRGIDSLEVAWSPQENYGKHYLIEIDEDNEFADFIHDDNDNPVYRTFTDLKK